MDAEKGSLLLDLKPYKPSVERVEKPEVPEWCKYCLKNVETSAEFSCEEEFDF